MAPETSTVQASSLRRRWISVGGCGRPTSEAEALQTKGRILIDRGNVDDGMAHLDEAMLFAGEGRLGPFATGKVYCSLIAACEELGDFDRAAEWTDATLRWVSNIPSPSSRASVGCTGPSSSSDGAAPAWPKRRLLAPVRSSGRAT